MKKLNLTTQLESANDRHTRIRVFQNGGVAGDLTVESEYAEQICRIISSCYDPVIVEEFIAWVEAHGTTGCYCARITKLGRKPCLYCKREVILSQLRKRKK